MEIKGGGADGTPKEGGRNARTVANNKYNTAAYDRIAVNVRKGERERLKEYAAGNNESVPGLVNRLLAAEVPGFDPISEK
ncbi:MAG: hypothetical protein NC548_22075 [Lachnospiraceae bacterium]|nr:hypothetical protein [Lachnospiraceae bacterium]